MARVVNEEEFTNRRNEILDAAQMLIYSKGYEQMTIQDVLQALNISKGAFYHYFDSKQALMEAIVERTTSEGVAILQPIIEDEGMTALEKFRKFFDAAGRWKTSRKDFFLALLRVWYMDVNAIVREKMQAAGMRSIAPMLGHIIQQGIREGVFHSAYPDQISEVVLGIMLNEGQAFARLLIHTAPGPELYTCAQRVVAAYDEVLERALNAPHGSLKMIDDETLREWVDVPRK